MSNVQQEESSGSVKTILIVEDDEGIGHMLVQVITQETPYVALLATDAFQALQFVKAIRPSLFLLDYNLPVGMNGLDLYDLLRTSEGFPHTPCILMSANMPRKQTQRRNLLEMHKP